MHPVNSNDFGVNGIAVVYSVNGANAVTGYIVKQLGQTKYVVAPGTSTNAAQFVTVSLATTFAQANAIMTNTVSGGSTIGTVVVMPYGSNVAQHAYNISTRKLLTVEGHTFNWRKTTAAHAGECNVSGNWITGPDASGFSDKVNV